MTSGKFLQSKEWEEFQKSLGRKTFRVNDSLIIKMPLKFGFSYLYSPKGPTDKLQITNYELRINNIAKKERAIFWRIEPSTQPNKNFVKTRDIQPRCTQILDLTQSEDKLLAEMKQKTRYNVRLAERRGVRIRNKELGIKNQNFEVFYTLLQQTSERQKINIHSKNYYKKLAGFNKIFIAYYNDKPIAGAMINFYGDTATYLHGGSSQEHKNLMAPYLLHWKIIKYAKEKDYKYYDWWGVDETRVATEESLSSRDDKILSENYEKQGAYMDKYKRRALNNSQPKFDNRSRKRISQEGPRWPGITKFKTGFGGKQVCTPGTFDLPINKLMYWLYKLVRK